jgi:hypothetical protein
LINLPTARPGTQRAISFVLTRWDQFVRRTIQSATDADNGRYQEVRLPGFWARHAVRLPVEGRFSFAMAPNDPIGLLSLLQTGDVPVNAQFLHFTSFATGVQVYINGSLVPVSYSYGPRPQNLNAWTASAEADISAFAGQTVELKFVSLSTFGTGTILNGLDSIYFSPVPEPATVSILVVGLFPLGLWRLCSRKGTSAQMRQ